VLFLVTTKKRTDFTEGPIFFKILLYTLPIMATGLLQHMYNMADNIVVGKFSGDVNALGAVGSTASFTSLIINIMLGLAGGVSVLISQSYGGKRYDILSRGVHTAMTFSLIIGVSLSCIGVLISRPGLILLGTKDVMLDSATLYMRIICLGIPASAVYNFGASILRSVGDSKTPLIILSTSGLLNVLLNVFFVVVCNMTVDGVALATIISQYASAAVVVAVLIIRKNQPYALKMKNLGIHGATLLRILRLGVPIAIQSSLFSISNILVQTAVNSFPPPIVSAKAIAASIDAMVYVITNSFLHASMTFTGQNFGAERIDRIKKGIVFSQIQVVIIGATIGQLILLFGEPLASLYIEDADPNRLAVMESTMEQLRLMLPLYFLCGVMESFSGVLRGLGYSMISMILCIAGSCGIRSIWIFTVFQLEPFHNMVGLYTCYPVSWIATSLAMAIVLVVVLKRLSKKTALDATAR
jgi:putative MATE family efflux protein